MISKEIPAISISHYEMHCKSCLITLDFNKQNFVDYIQ